MSSHFLFPFSVLLGTSFIFKTRWVTVKEVFLLSITWLVCKRDEAALIIMSVSVLVKLTWRWCTLHTKRAIQRKHDFFVFAALGFYFSIEDFLLSTSYKKKKKMLTALDKRWTTAQEQAMPRHRRFLSKRSAFFPEKKWLLNSQKICR